jgi:hypothetical protein
MSRPRGKRVPAAREWIPVGTGLPGKWVLSHGRDCFRRATMVGMAFLGQLVFYTIFVLLARRAAVKLWRVVREQGTGALVIRLPRLADIGWGAALVPVTILYLAVFGAFTLYDQAGRANLFSATTPAGSFFFSALTLITGKAPTAAARSMPAGPAARQAMC